MLGSKGTKALDKSLNNYFEIEKEVYKVISSYVYVEIENDKNNIYTLRRNIHGDIKGKLTIKVFEGACSSIDDDDTKELTLIVHRIRNHVSEISFFKWFADFLGFNIPKVTNQKGELSSLYFQTIFPAFFIEQTKGWSNFLASTPYFGIKNNNQRTIEFVLDLKALLSEVKKEKLCIETKEIENEWNLVINKMDVLAKEHMGKIINVSNTPVKDSNIILLSSLKIRRTYSNNESISIQNLIDELDVIYNDFDTNPKLAQDISYENRKKLESKNKEYQEYKEGYSSFKKGYQAQKSQLVSYKNYLSELDEELDVNKDIRYLVEKDSTVNNLEICPTCNRNIGNSIVNSDLDVELKTIKGNIGYLENQHKLLINSITNLESILEEKTLISKFYINDIHSLEKDIKAIHNEFCDPDKMPSRIQIYQQIDTKTKIEKLTIAQSSFDLLKLELLSISKRYAKNQSKLNSINIKNEEDIKIINTFEKKFKTNLFNFGYKSNNKNEIHIQKKYPFKYFPVSGMGEGVQKIQISSSSSDYIRSIWAFTISLLEMGENHPGIIMFDEPSQHSMKRDSLEKLFTKLSTLKDKQIIVAASTDEHRNTEDKKEYSIDQALTGLTYNEYEIITASIQKMD